MTIRALLAATVLLVGCASTDPTAAVEAPPVLDAGAVIQPTATPEPSASECERIGYNVVSISQTVEHSERDNYRDTYLAEQGFTPADLGYCLTNYPYTMVLMETQAQRNNRIYLSTFP